MRLTFVHRLLIGAAMAGGVAFVAHALYQYARLGDSAELWMAALGAVAVIGLGAYLRYFLRRLRGGPKGPPSEP